MTDAERDEVGSLGEEAAKLLGALSGWAREHGVEAGDGLSGTRVAGRASAHELNDHLATGAAECTVCPLCRTVSAVRQVSPEVTAHLSAAATSLAQAAAALMATAPRTPAPGTTSSTSTSQTTGPPGRSSPLLDEARPSQAAVAGGVAERALGLEVRAGLTDRDVLEDDVVDGIAEVSSPAVRSDGFPAHSPVVEWYVSLSLKW